MQHHAWPNIVSFDKVLKYVREFPEILGNNHKVKYRAKVKLDGTNASLVLDFKNQTIIPQSREMILVDGKDNAGFAAWHASNKRHQQELLGYITNDAVFWGEWCGRGIKTNCSIGEIDTKHFVIFAGKFIETDKERELISNPNILNFYFNNYPQTKVLPWYGEEIEVDFDNEANIAQNVEKFNQMVLDVESNDPWVKEQFGIDGVGEGLVFYPISNHFSDEKGFSSFNDFKNLAFKAKGSKHSVIKTKEPVQMDVSMANSVSDFVALVLPEPRLEQGAKSVFDGELKFDKSKIGNFLKWIEKDIQKECQAELSVSNLSWKDVAKSVSDFARKWYFSKL